MNWLDELFSGSQASSGGGDVSLEPESYSAQVIKCDRPLLAVYSGPQTVSLTADRSAAKDNCKWRLLFPAGSWTTVAINADLDPSGTAVYEFGSTLDDHLLESVFNAAGNCFTTTVRRVKTYT